MVQVQIGIDIGGTKMLFVAKSQETHKCWQLSTGINFSAADAEAAIYNFIQELPDLPSSIGIAIPGLVSQKGQVIACDVLPNIVGWFPSAMSFLSCPVRVLNDAEAAVVEEVHELEPHATAAVVLVGTGIGAAFYANGQILRGSLGWAGELGSIPIGSGDGNTLDAQASGAAILKRLGVDANQLTALIEQNDPVALQAIAQAGESLGLGIATVINLFNPELVVLAGGTLRWLGYLEAALISAQTHSLPDLWAACRIQQSTHGSALVALGAARAAAELER